MSALWTTEELLAATRGRPLGHLPEEITGISIDSRSLKPGEAFFAIKGDRVDGHDFASAAMAAGAGLLVVAEAKLPALGRLVTVDTHGLVRSTLGPRVVAEADRAGVARRGVIAPGVCRRCAAGPCQTTT